MIHDNTRLKESLSALMDDSADELELHRTLKAVSDDSELRESWSRYQLARSAMHRELPPVSVDLSAAISAAIAEEPTHSQGFGRFLKPLTRAAIAASVTVVAVLGVQQYNLNGAQPESSPMVAEAEPQVIAPMRMPSGFELPVATRTVSSGGKPVVHQPQRQLVLMGQPSLDPATRQQVQVYFNELMKRHTERAALGNNQGMLPFARLPQQPQDAE